MEDQGGNQLNLRNGPLRVKMEIKNKSDFRSAPFQRRNRMLSAFVLRFLRIKPLVKRMLGKKG
ncbi:hypothetical protein TH63_14230 [Rufibacter radiotolerans]|uniref:Uncharacterized protein n=1 Tax=Rufibacter radiotolerans TaxID=1379910 RepID=A0A0H4VMG1_9BACT|nr:hypothetical protein TH63_14230 [Rufibacter radiotolerans]